MNAQQFLRARGARHALFIGANLGILAFVYLVAVAPIAGYLSDRSERLADLQTTLARYEAVAAQENAVQDYAGQVAESNTRGELLAGESEGIVNANLQARLKAVSESAGVSVRSLQSLPVKAIRGASLYGARLEVSGSLEAIHTLTRSLEGEPPLLLITAATLRGESNLWGAPSQGEESHSIDAQFDVYGGAALKEHS